MVLRPRIPAPDWSNGRCAGTVNRREDYDPWFDDEDVALEICNREVDGGACAIRHECLIFALANNNSDGVYGGMSPLGRKALRKRWKLPKSQRVEGRAVWVPHPEWRWMPDDQALTGLDVEELKAEPDDDD